MNRPTAPEHPLTEREVLDLEAHLTQARSALTAGEVVSVTLDAALQLVRYRLNDETERSLPARNVLSAARRET